MDNSLGDLLYLIIKWSVLIVSIIGIMKIFFFKKNKNNQNTKRFTFIAIVIASYLFIGNYIEHRNGLITLSETFGVENYNCKRCIGCHIHLNKNGTYQITKDEIILDIGEWDFKKSFVTTYIIIDKNNSYNYHTMKKNNMIKNMKNTNCK